MKEKRLLEKFYRKVLDPAVRAGAVRLRKKVGANTCKQICYYSFAAAIVSLLFFGITMAIVVFKENLTLFTVSGTITIIIFNGALCLAAIAIRATELNGKPS